MCFWNIGDLMSRDTSKGWNINVKKKRESNVYKESKESSKKTITLVKVSVNDVSSLSLGSKSSNRGFRCGD